MPASIFYLSLGIAAIVSCTGVKNKASKNAALVEDYLSAVQNLDYNLMETFLSEDYMGYGPPPL